MTNGYMVYLLRILAAQGALASVYTDPDDPEGFSAGFVEAVDGQHVLMCDLSPWGQIDGWRVRRNQDVIQVLAGEEYEQRLAMLLAYHKQHHRCFFTEAPAEDTDLLLSVLIACKERGEIVSVIMGDDMITGRVLEANGAKVVREYYFNDHGEQINRFAKSLVAAWAEANNLGEAGYQTETPCDGYKGAYINEIAARVQAEAESDGVDLTALAHQDQGLNDDGEPLGEADTEVREEFRKRAVPMMFDEIQKSMKDFRVNFDVWFHENSLYADGKVDAAIEELKSRGDIFDKDGATWFESTKHGDDKDRVIIKSNGEFAYFAADIAYYWDKRHRAENSADVAIYMLGADHHGYIGRMMAMCEAFGDKPGENMQILIGQLVNVMKDGKAVRMSKRAGNVVTIDDLTDAIGVDASRYSLARTDYNSPVDIDLNLLSSHSNENPVYYVQYAHARSKNVDRNAAAAGISYEGADLALLDTEADGEVLAALAQFPSVLATAADDRQPHKVARYLEELAATYHKWYNVERVVPMALTDPETRGDDEARKALEIAKNPEPARAAARLKLNDAVQQVIANGLDLLGVTAPEKM